MWTDMEMLWRTGSTGKPIASLGSFDLGKYRKGAYSATHAITHHVATWTISGSELTPKTWQIGTARDDMRSPVKRIAPDSTTTRQKIRESISTERGIAASARGIDMDCDKCQAAESKVAAVALINKALDKDLGNTTHELALAMDKIALEHDNYLAVHRDNMSLATRNMELKAKVARLAEALKGLKYEWGCWCAHDHTEDDPGSEACLLSELALRETEGGAK